MTKEQTNALDALITWVDGYAGGNALRLSQVLTALRDAHPEPAQETREAEIVRLRMERQIESLRSMLDDWRAWSNRWRDKRWPGTNPSDMDLRSWIDREYRQTAEARDASCEVADAWGEWAEQLCPGGTSSVEHRAEIARLDLEAALEDAQSELTEWTDWGARLAPSDDADDTRDAIESQCDWAQSWFNWARRLSGNKESESIEETRAEVARRVELGRREGLECRYAAAIGRIECTLGFAGDVPLDETVKAVERLVELGRKDGAK